MSTDSIELAKARDILLEYDEQLRADDPRFNYAIHIVSDAGATMFIPNAFYAQYKDWYMVFAEHYNAMIFHKDEAMISMFQHTHADPWRLVITYKDGERIIRHV